jgi:hypothetical protein
MIREQWGCRRKWSWPNLRYYSSIYLEKPHSSCLWVSWSARVQSVSHCSSPGFEFWSQPEACRAAVAELPRRDTPSFVPVARVSVIGKQTEWKIWQKWLLIRRQENTFAEHSYTGMLSAVCYHARALQCWNWSSVLRRHLHDHKKHLHSFFKASTFELATHFEFTHEPRKKSKAVYFLLYTDKRMALSVRIHANLIVPHTNIAFLDIIHWPVFI